MKRIPAVLFLLSVAFLSSAQNFSGSRKYDGVHSSEYSTYLMGGYNVVTGTFVGEAVTYTRHLSDRWSVTWTPVHMDYEKK